MKEHKVLKCHMKYLSHHLVVQAQLMICNMALGALTTVCRGLNLQYFFVINVNATFFHKYIYMFLKTTGNT